LMVLAWILTYKQCLLLLLLYLLLIRIREGDKNEIYL